MFISKVSKKNKKSDKTYLYYRLMRSYRIGNKTRQELILDMGTLDDLPPEQHKVLADRIEEILNNENSLFGIDAKIEKLARQFANKIIENKHSFANRTIEKKVVEEGEESDFQEVDINSVESENAREIGCEWLAKQAIEQIGLDKVLASITGNEKLLKTSQISIISRMVHPSSELETTRWLNENTGLNQLFDLPEDNVSRYELNKAAVFLYENKEVIEKQLYKNIENLFSLQNKIVIYDLTNLFFEGRKQGSEYCKFGRSKEKRSDCRLVCVALLVDIHGFITYSHFYSGNQSEPATLADVVSELKEKLGVSDQSPVIVMDAGIATEANLKDLRDRKYNYVCVSRSKLTNYEFIDEQSTIVQDARKNKIELRKVKTEKKEDNFIWVKSEQKAEKENSMDERFTERFEKELTQFNENLQKKGAHRKSAEVYQRIGRLKEKNRYISGQYEISFTLDDTKETVTQIQWKRKQVKNPYDGTYFLRYSDNNLENKAIWDVYNTVREVEQSFRTLKTDLRIRPIHHQNDTPLLAHIFVGILAYQVVNSIRFQLKKQELFLSWEKLANRISTYKSVSTQMTTRDGRTIILKYCLRPTPFVTDIFQKLKFKVRPFKKQKFVVT